MTKGPWGSALLHSILFQTLVRSFGKTPCPDILLHFRVAHRVGTINETSILLPCHFLSVCVPNVHLPNFLLEFRQGRAAKRTERGVRRHLFVFLMYTFIPRPKYLKGVNCRTCPSTARSQIACALAGRNGAARSYPLRTFLASVCRRASRVLLPSTASNLQNL